MKMSWMPSIDDDFLNSSITVPVGAGEIQGLSEELQTTVF